MKKTVREKLYAQLGNFNKAEIKNLIQFLDDERQLLDAIFNVIQESILIVDKHGNILHYNQAAQYLLGFQEKPNLSIWHWIPALKNYFTDQQSIRPDFTLKEFELTYPEKRSVRIHLQNFPTKEKNYKNYILVIQDITKEKADNEQRLVVEKLDSVVQLSSEVAHELGNPLNSIGIHLQLIQRKIKTLILPESITHSLQVCSEEVARLDEIVKHFLEAVRPHSMKIQPENVEQLLKKVLSVFAPQLENLNIQVKLENKTSISQISIDKARLHQAFFNLIKNAIEAIGSHGWINISLMNDETDFIVAFADSGKGISHEQASRIFEGRETSNKANGHGIGMLIVRRIMQEHGGHVEIESKSNVGSIVYLKFPLKFKNFKSLETTLQ